MPIVKLPLRLALTATVLALCLVLAPGALAAKGAGAGKPPRSGTGTISLVLLNSTDGLAHYGQTVTFNVATPATPQPWVNLQCFQNGVLVAQGWNGYFDGSLTGRNFGLAAPSWSGGAADCTAYLTTPDWTRLASTSFHVYA
jgi:hypothetical protein